MVLDFGGDEEMLLNNPRSPVPIRNKPKIKTITIPGIAFIAVEPDVNDVTYTEDNVVRSNALNNYFICPLVLPNKSIIYSITAKGSNTAKTIDILESAQSDLTQTQTFGSITMNGTENKLANGRILNNSLFFYSIFSNDINTNETIGFVKIKYIDGDEV